MKPGEIISADMNLWACCMRALHFPMTCVVFPVSHWQMVRPGFATLLSAFPDDVAALDPLTGMVAFNNGSILEFRHPANWQQLAPKTEPFAQMEKVQR